MKTLKWFKDRIGKRIYRYENDCPCDYCKNIHLNGLIIKNILHAQYLFDIQTEIGYSYYDNNKTNTRIKRD